MRPTRQTSNGSCRGAGFILLDAIGALILLTALVSALAASSYQQHRALAALDAGQAALRLAERTMTDLQHGRPPATRVGAGRVRLVSLPQAAPVGGWRWVRVEVSYEGSGASLTGLVPRKGPRSP
ncbi:MAG: hypothetical protein OER86_12725 [Phycisphaerae bacterium]|nr:hypothetical protein [Phycisphaerae bacterium]